jgi:hypothetical protein
MGGERNVKLLRVCMCERNSGRRKISFWFGCWKVQELLAAQPGSLVSGSLDRTSANLNRQVKWR